MRSLPQKIESSKKGLVIKPMIFSEMNSRAQVDLIDMRSHSDGDLNDTHMEELVLLKKFIEIQGWLLLTFLTCFYTIN